MAPPHAVTPALVDDSSDFWTRHVSMCRDVAAAWSSTVPEMPRLGPHTGFLRQRSNARAAARLIDRLAGEIEQLPDERCRRRAWRETVRERLHQFGEQRLRWPVGYRRLLFGDAFYEASMTFAREARTFDPQLPFEHVGQALRNVWIGHTLQMLLDRPVEMGPGLFAYSMLYPVTDNWLDDPRVSSDLKREFNDRFGRRLAGLPVHVVDARDRKVDRLIERIEGEFPRGEFPGVYAGLLAIHAAQTRSLAQHDGTELSEAELLAISVEKGGSSVLADLSLVCPFAERAAERFAFGYGVFLQLLDDLQDVDADLGDGHQTLFTRAACGGRLDETTARLARFIDTVLASEERFTGPAFAERLDLIRRNCLALLVGSIAEQPQYFSRRFRRHLARQWPVSFGDQRRLRRRAVRRWSDVQASVDIERGMPRGPNAVLVEDSRLAPSGVSGK
jgi:hypothetical protein